MTGPTNFPRVEVSPSHSSCWSPSTFSVSSVAVTGSQSGPRLGHSPSRSSIPRYSLLTFCLIFNYLLPWRYLSNEEEEEDDWC